MSVVRKQKKSFEDKVINILESTPDKKITTFTQFEIDTIIKYYPTKGSPAVASALGKTVRQIKDKAYALGLTRKTT